MFWGTIFWRKATSTDYFVCRSTRTNLDSDTSNPRYLESLFQTSSLTPYLYRSVTSLVCVLSACKGILDFFYNYLYHIVNSFDSNSWIPGAPIGVLKYNFLGHYDRQTNHQHNQITFFMCIIIIIINKERRWADLPNVTFTFDCTGRSIGFYADLDFDCMVRMDLVYWIIRMARFAPFHERRPSMRPYWSKLVIGPYKVVPSFWYGSNK